MNFSNILSESVLKQVHQAGNAVVANTEQAGFDPANIVQVNPHL